METRARLLVSYLQWVRHVKLSEDTKEMLNVLQRECTRARELGKARMRQDTEDVTKLEAQFMKYEVFQCMSDLVVVAVLYKSNANVFISPKFVTFLGFSTKKYRIFVGSEFSAKSHTNSRCLLFPTM